MDQPTPSSPSTATAPIALFVYNRPDHTRQTVEALQRNALASESDLFVYADAPKNPGAADKVAEVRSYVRGIAGFRSVTVVEREKNWGVDPSVIDGVTTLCNRFGRVIVLEDDIVTSQWFLTFMNEGLARYERDAAVMQISGFMFPVKGFDASKASFLPYATCWGWGTWQRAWAQFDATAAGYETLKTNKRKRKSFDLNGAFYYYALLEQVIEGKSDAWDIRWYLSMFMQGGLALFPHKSLVNNIGFDGSGVHSHDSHSTEGEVSHIPVREYPEINTNRTLSRSIEAFLYSKQPKTFRNFLRKVLR